MKTQNTQRQNSIDSNRKQAAPLNELTGFQRDLLRTIAGLEESDGVGVQEVIEASYGKEITHPTLYKNLDQLCDKGLVEKGMIDGRTNKYTLTEAGERAYCAHLTWMIDAGGAD